MVSSEVWANGIVIDRYLFVKLMVLQTVVAHLLLHMLTKLSSPKKKATTLTSSRCLSTRMITRISQMWHRQPLQNASETHLDIANIPSTHDLLSAFGASTCRHLTPTWRPSLIFVNFSISNLVLYISISRENTPRKRSVGISQDTFRSTLDV